MVENFEKVWGIIIIAIPMVVGLVTLIVQATPTPKDDDVWSKIALIIGRVFSVKSHKGADGKSKVSVPVLQGTKND